MAFPKYWNEKIETMPDEELRELQEKKLRAH
jgi:phenylacetate-coenzyme A ligase PaaK-like adenylate-forming protein